jgi:hypothetical protein
MYNIVYKQKMEDNMSLSTSVTSVELKTFPPSEEKETPAGKLKSRDVIQLKEICEFLVKVACIYMSIIHLGILAVYTPILFPMCIAKGLIDGENFAQAVNSFGSIWDENLDQLKKSIDMLTIK